MTQADEINVLNSIQYGGEPVATFRKTILGKVFIHVWNSFMEAPEGILLVGRPTSDTAIYDIWNEKELKYFEAKNKRLLITGNIVKHIRKDTDEKEEQGIETYTDEELTVLLKKKYFALRSFLDKTESVPLLFRLVTLAEEVGKSSKTVDAIRSRLAEVQVLEFESNKKEDDKEDY